MKYKRKIKESMGIVENLLKIEYVDFGKLFIIKENF